MEGEAGGDGDGGDGDVFKAEGAVAAFAEEVDVEVVVVGAVGVAEFVAGAVCGVFQNVHEAGLSELLQGAEHY